MGSPKTTGALASIPGSPCGSVKHSYIQIHLLFLRPCKGLCLWWFSSFFTFKSCFLNWLPFFHLNAGLGGTDISAWCWAICQYRPPGLSWPLERHPDSASCWWAPHGQPRESASRLQQDDERNCQASSRPSNFSKDRKDSGTCPDISWQVW